MDYGILNILKFLLAIFVVCMHCIGPDVEFLSFSVPVYFLMSGFFFFNNPKGLSVDGQYFVGKFRRRFYSLLIPYVLWIVLYYLYMRIAETQKLDEMMVDKNWLRVFWDVNPDGNNPLLGPFWYVRDLMECCLLSPVFYVLLRNKLVGGFVLILLSMLFMFSSFNILTLNAKIMLFFSIGAYMGLHQMKMPILRDDQLVLLLVLTIGIFSMTYCFHLGSFHLLHCLYLLLCFPTLYFSFQWLQRKIRIPTFIFKDSGLSFFVYSVHMFFYSVAFYITTDCMKLEHGSRTIATPMVLILSYATYWLLKRYQRSVFNVLIGNRNTARI